MSRIYMQRRSRDWVFRTKHRFTRSLTFLLLAPLITLSSVAFFKGWPTTVMVSPLILAVLVLGFCWHKRKSLRNLPSRIKLNAQGLSIALGAYENSTDWLTIGRVSLSHAGELQIQMESGQVRQIPISHFEGAATLIVAAVRQYHASFGARKANLRSGALQSVQQAVATGSPPTADEPAGAVRQKLLSQYSAPSLSPVHVLTSMLLGDSEKAQRLMDYERRSPQETDEGLALRAIKRLQRDLE